MSHHHVTIRPPRNYLDRLASTVRPVLARLLRTVPNDSVEGSEFSLTFGRQRDHEDEQLRAAAAELLLMRKARRKYLPAPLFGEPGWEVLLIAFSSPRGTIARGDLLAEFDGKSIAVDRWIDALCGEGLLEQLRFGAVTPIATSYGLTEKALHALRATLRDILQS